MTIMKKLLITLLICSFCGVFNVSAKGSFFDNPQVTEYGTKIDNSNYSKDDSFIYYYNDILKGADLDTFEVISSNMGKDKNNIYHSLDVLLNVDRETFKMLDYRYAKDMNNIYFIGSIFKTLPLADLQTFKIKDNGFFAGDDKNVYVTGKIINNADLETIEILPFAHVDDFYMSMDNLFLRDKNNVYFMTDVILDADPDTFEIITENYFRDKNNTYYYEKCDSHYCDDSINLIESVDIDSFEIINNKLSKDKNNVYCKKDISVAKDYFFDSNLYNKYIDMGMSFDEVTEGSVKNKWNRQILYYMEPESFKALNDYYFTNNQSVYFGNGCPEEMLHIDFSTFEVVNEFLAKDKFSIFAGFYKLPEIGNSNITVLNENFIKGNNNIYNIANYLSSYEDIDYLLPKLEKVDGISTYNFEYIGSDIYKNYLHVFEENDGEFIILEGVDRESFEIINDKYAKDKNHIYDIEHTLEIKRGVDPETFEAINGYYTKDKNGVYGIYDLDAADPETFEVINEDYNANYGKDSSKAYVNSTLIPYADPDTFEYAGLVFSKDKRHVYMFAEKLEGVGIDIEFLSDYSDPDDDHWYNYFTDGNYIYCIDGYASVKRLSWVDVDTFKIIDDHRFNDKNGSYINSAGYSSFTTMVEECYIGECTVSSSHVSSSELMMSVKIDDYDKVSDFYIKDENNAYYLPYGTERLSDAMPIFDIHSPTFEVVSDFYTKDMNNVYYRWFSMPNADPKTFEVLGKNIAKDRNQIYYFGDIITGADPATLEIVRIEVESEWYESLGQEAIDEMEKQYGDDWYSPEVEKQIKDKNGIYKIVDGQLVDLEDKSDSYQYIDRKMINGGFSDIDMGYRPYRDSIENLTYKKIIRGYDDGTFRPENTINRAEALKVILKSIDTDAYYREADSDFNTFLDVNYNSWYAKYIKYAVDNEIINGYDDGTFKPGNTVNYLETLKMLFKANKIDVFQNSKTPWYQEYVDAAYKLHFYMDNDDDDVLTRPLTRVELVYMVDSIMNAVEDGYFNSKEWRDYQKIERNDGKSNDNGIDFSYREYPDNKVKWSWSGPSVEDGVLYQLWSEDEMLVETDKKAFVISYNRCSSYQIVKLRVSKVTNPTEEDWGLFSGTREVYFGEHGTVSEREGIKIMIECLSDDKRKADSLYSFVRDENEYDASLNLGLKKMLYYITGILRHDWKYEESEEHYSYVYYYARCITIMDFDAYIDGEDISRSILFSVISHINHISDLSNRLDIAEDILFKK